MTQELHSVQASVLGRSLSRCCGIRLVLGLNYFEHRQGEMAFIVEEPPNVRHVAPSLTFEEFLEFHNVSILETMKHEVNC